MDSGGFLLKWTLVDMSKDSALRGICGEFGPVESLSRLSYTKNLVNVRQVP